MKLEFSTESGLGNDAFLREMLVRDGQISLNYAVIETEVREVIAYIFSQNIRFHEAVAERTQSNVVLTAGRLVMTRDMETNCDHSADDVTFPPVTQELLAETQKKYGSELKQSLKEKLQSLHIDDTAGSVA
ncbi:MAG TPA: hypothetical protein VHA78_04955 [Candidatus Peribacteraceae bacterium]|nr:hypothetical protein [Candidatus Peribacteraceae bacterium]